jgi:hypothetical protein
VTPSKEIRISSQKRTAFCICSFRPDAKIHFASSRKTRLTGKQEQNWLLINELCSTHSIYFSLPSLLLGLCPECLEKQVLKSLLATAARTRHSSEARILLFRMSDRQEGKLVDNQYDLINPWKDMWVHYVGGKFPYYFISCDTQIYIT